MAGKAAKLDVENVLQAGKTYRVDAAKYQEMRRAFLSVVTEVRPGNTVAELTKRIKATLSDEIFPGGATAGWWLKCVQLDLEAKKIIAREEKPPVRLYLC